MRRPAALFPIALALGTVILAPAAGARETIKIKACQTISQPGSYELVDNLTAAAAADCLVITANDVTIDLAGFSISGHGMAVRGSRGIGIGGAVQGIAVRNGSVSGFQDEVDLGLSCCSIVEGLRVFGLGVNATGGTGISANGIVKGNTVISATATGIFANGGSDR